jgi:hypothetical protein
MTYFEAPKKAIGLGFNAAMLPYRPTRWAAGVIVRHVADVYRQQTVSGKELADAIQLEIPAHNAIVGKDALDKVPKVEELLGEATREVEMLQDMDADPVQVQAAIRKRRKIVSDLGILRATAYGMIGKSLRQVVRNDVPEVVPADIFPPDVETTVLDVAVESNIKPYKLDLPGADKEVIAERLVEHKEDFM